MLLKLGKVTELPPQRIPFYVEEQQNDLDSVSLTISCGLPKPCVRSSSAQRALREVA